MVNLLVFFSSTAEGSLCRYGVFVCHIFQHCLFSINICIIVLDVEMLL